MVEGVEDAFKSRVDGVTAGFAGDAGTRDERVRFGDEHVVVVSVVSAMAAVLDFAVLFEGLNDLQQVIDNNS